MRVNWGVVIMDLRAKHCGIRGIAREVRVSPGTVCKWQDCHGWEPRHSAGERLIAHWMRKTGKGRVELPVW